MDNEIKENVIKVLDSGYYVLGNECKELEKQFAEGIFYMGMDIIEGKNYERFMFQKGGFFEIMIDPPLAMNAHFLNPKRAKLFQRSLKKTFSGILEKNPVSQMFVNSIEVNSEEEENLTYATWDKLKSIRK